MSVAFTRAPQTPVLVNCVSFLDFPYRMAAEHPERFAQYLIQAMSRGASISTYIMGRPGAITYPSLEVAGEITRFHRDQDVVYAGLRPAAEVVLVAPGEHMDRGPIPPRVAEFRGLYAALRELHVPFDVVEADRLHAFLSESDFVVVTAPLTPSTTKLLGEPEFRAMKPSAHVICYSRGGIIDDALLTALKEGWIAGAGLDAHGIEPLPPHSPFWDLENVIVTPHNGATTAATRRRGVDIFAANLERFCAGEALTNVVDKSLGY